MFLSIDCKVIAGRTSCFFGKIGPMMGGTPQPLRFSMIGRRLCSVVTLLAYVVTTHGLPINQCAGDPSPHCCCGEDLKTTSQCCCRKANRSGPPKSCCTASLQKKTPSKPCSEKKATCCSKAHSRSKSCCQRSEKSCCQSKSSSGCPTSPESEGQFVSACRCGGPANSGVLLDAEPRILPDSVAIWFAHDGIRLFPLSDLFPPSRSIPPETPPPKVRPDRLSLN